MRQRLNSPCGLVPEADGDRTWQWRQFGTRVIYGQSPLLLYTRQWNHYTLSNSCPIYVPCSSAVCLSFFKGPSLLCLDCMLRVNEVPLLVQNVSFLVVPTAECLSFTVWNVFGARGLFSHWLTSLCIFSALVGNRVLRGGATWWHHKYIEAGFPIWYSASVMWKFEASGAQTLTGLCWSRRHLDWRR